MTTTKKICILHRYPVSEAIGTNPSLPETFAELKRNGFEIIFISYKELESDKKIPGIIYDEFGTSLDRGSKHDVLWKAILWLFLVPWKCRAVRKRHGVNNFYCDDSGPFYPLFMKWILGRKSRVFMRFGDLQSGYQLLGRSKLHSFLFKISLALERLQWKKVDAIIPLSTAFKKFLSRQGINEKKVYVVEESIDLTQFKPGIESNVRGKYEIENRRVVMFHGAVAHCKGLETFLQAAKIVTEKYPDITFMLVGDGPALSGLRELAQKLNLKKPQLVFTGWIPFAKMPTYLAASDIGVVMRSSNFANNFVVTTALLQIWASGKPMVAPNLEAIAGVTRNRQNGLLYEPDNAKNLAGQIELLLSDENLANKIAANGTASTADFEQSHIGKKLAQILIRKYMNYKSKVEKI